MTAGYPLPQDIRDQVAAAIQHGIDNGQVPSHRALAEQFGISKGAVYDIADENGLGNAWEDQRARTEAANATNAARLAEKRLRLQEASLDAAADWLDRRDEDYAVVTRTMEGTEVDRIAPGPHEWKAIGQGVQALSNSAVAFARLDSELAGAGQASGLLDDIEMALRDRRLEREAASRADEL